jgi:hypothetical protein
MNNQEREKNGPDKDHRDDDKDCGKHEHHPEPPGRIVHPRPSHGDSGTQ